MALNMMYITNDPVVARIAEANGISNPRRLVSGEMLVVPALV